MQHPTVELISYDPNAEQTVCGAAKLCYASNPETIFSGSADDVAMFLKRLRSMGHMSPFEHTSYSFLLQGVSRALTHQLVRHRLASYSQRSQRYVDHAAFEYIIPPSLAGRQVQTPAGPQDAVEFYCRHMERTAEVYAALRDALGGPGESANEDARYVLPNAAETKIVVTMNARELLHFFAERLCNRAQWEIRRVAAEMLRLVKAASPLLFAGAGPKCVALKACPEGKLTCGKFAEMRESYRPE